MSVLRLATASTTTSPPRPPSPPSGPPNSMNFSRRKLHAPAPPSPLFTKILAWSRNFIAVVVRSGFARSFRSLAPQMKRGNAAIPPRALLGWRASAGRNSLVGGLRRQRRDRNERPALGRGVKAHGARRLGEEGVVAAHIDIVAGMILGAALADDDVAGHHRLAAEFLDAEPPAA